MERQVIDALIKKQAEIKEQIRWREASIANVSDKYATNKPYLDRIKAEVSTFRRQEYDVARKLEEYNKTEPATPYTKPKPSNSSVSAQQTPEEPEPTVEFEGPVHAPGERMSYSQGDVQKTRAEATKQDLSQFNQTGDWRVRLSLASGSNYFYNSPDAGILKPLANTSGIVFPYTPTVSVSYNANYDSADIVHSNYKAHNYRNSAVDNVSISCVFTAQDTAEANYILAVIHFLRSATKMFYGKDDDPKNGTPPPLCFLTGFGEFQFNGHPLLIQNFTYNLPNDVDYIKAIPLETPRETSTSVYAFLDPSQRRMMDLAPGGNNKQPTWSNKLSNSKPTYVPTKIQIQITALPVATRNAVSNEFSLKQYANGSLLQGNKRVSGGMW